MTPKVSVVVPNFNHAKFLRQRIESVLCQTFKDFELIILDDCSIDGSASIINEYANHPLVAHVLINEVNSKSPFLQWRKGIELAVGEWIWIAESDDFADEDFLEKMLRAAEGKSNVGLIYCDSVVVNDFLVTDQTFASIKNNLCSTKRWSYNYYNNGFDEIENYLLPYGTINNTSAVLFNKAVLTQVNPFDFPFRYIGDKYTFVKVLSQSAISYVSESLNYYRNPFNTKHFSELHYYFFEQFIVFNWVYRNLPVNRKKFFQGYYRNTQSSLFRGWGKVKLNIYLRVFQVNRYLLFLNVVHNLFRPIAGRIRNMIHSKK